MRDLFGDPILLIPVVIILTIFGIGYVGFMIWAYNRDAKKQGKQSGCLPMLLLFSLIVITGCRHSGTSRLLDGSYCDVWQAAMEANPWFSRHADSFDVAKGYADIRQSEWGITTRYQISVCTIINDPPGQQIVNVKYSEWTGLFNSIPSSKAHLVEEELITLDQIERRLFTIQGQE